MRKKALITILLLLAIIFISMVSYERLLMRRYEETKLQISVNELKKSWGNPDNDFICKDCAEDRVLIYKTVTGFTQYVFKFDKNSKLLVQKYAED